MKLAATILLPLALVVAGCQTPYGAITSDGGVESTWLSPTLLQVTSRGNTYSSPERIREYGVLKAAEKAEETGYKFFVIKDVRDETKTVTTYSPVTSSTRTLDDGTKYTSHYGGIPTNNIAPGYVTTYEMFQAAPPEYRPGQYYEVSVVLPELRAKYIEPKKN